MSPSNYIKYYELYFNDFLSVLAFAEYCGFTRKQAHKVLLFGRTLKQDQYGYH